MWLLILMGEPITETIQGQLIWCIQNKDPQKNLITPTPQNVERHREACTPPEHTVIESLEFEGSHKDQTPTPCSLQDYLKLSHVALDAFCKIRAAEDLSIMDNNDSSFIFSVAPMLVL